MKSGVLGLLLTLVLAAAAWAEFSWPTELVPVKINNRQIAVSWKDGRPFAQRVEVYGFLKLPREGDPSVDLIEELAKHKTKITQKADGSIDVIVVKEITGGQVDPAQAAKFKAEYEDQKRAKEMEPRLVASGARFVAESGFIRAKVTITNTGGSGSESCLATCEFIDWYGHPFAKDVQKVGPLEPGEGEEHVFFSVVERNSSDANQSDKYTCRVKFSGQSGPAREINSGTQSK